MIKIECKHRYTKRKINNTSFTVVISKFYINDKLIETKEFQNATDAYLWSDYFSEGIRKAEKMKPELKKIIELIDERESKSDRGTLTRIYSFCVKKLKESEENNGK